MPEKVYLAVNSGTGTPEERKTKQMVAIVIGVLLVMCIALVIALGVLTVVVVQLRNQEREEVKPETQPFCSDKTQLKTSEFRSAGMYDDLTVKEIIAVRNFLLKQPALNLTSTDSATIASNYIYLIEFQQPDKDAALVFLDRNGSKPQRNARVVIIMGDQNKPSVEGYIVGPTDQPTSFEKRQVQGTVPFDSRPISTPEIDFIEAFVGIVARKLRRVLYESFDGYTYHNCSSHCLTWSHDVRQLQSGHRLVFVWFHRYEPGSYINPTGLELVINTSGNDASLWSLEKLFYYNQTFDSVRSFYRAYDNGQIYKMHLKAPDREKPLYSSYERRGGAQPHKPLRPPQIFEPDGKRYTVSGHHIEYMGWSFDFRVRSSSGLQLFDIRFKDERIIYELSLQEAEAFYSGFSLTQMTTNFLDSLWGLGFSNYELVSGVDCPDTATFFDNVHFCDTDKPQEIKNAVCLFEMNTGIPLRRHFDNDFEGGYSFYGGMPGSVLILRTITTAYNYDYVFDYVFHPNGVIEVRVSTTGYIHATHWTNAESPYGYQIYKGVAGTLHDHIINYKVDLDVVGRKNSYQTIDIEVENITNPWFPGMYHVQKVLKRFIKNTEKESLLTYNFDQPKYLNFLSERSRNSNDVNRGYRIQIRDMAKQLYPDSWAPARGAAWSRYQMAVTKYNDTEERSSSMYNQINPFEPVVDFRKFFSNDENIRDEDLVAWVSIGGFHIPHSEDIPNTATAGNTFGFYIRPFNFFDEDPSMASTDAVLITPTDDDFSGTKIEQFGKSDSQPCAPRKEPIKFRGVY